MFLVKNYKTGRYYKTKYDITNDILRQLHSLPFIKAGVMTEAESFTYTKCLEKWSFIEVVMRFDGRRNTWMRDCKWFTWLCVIEDV